MFSVLIVRKFELLTLFLLLTFGLGKSVRLESDTIAKLHDLSGPGLVKLRDVESLNLPYVCIFHLWDFASGYVAAVEKCDCVIVKPTYGLGAYLILVLQW